MTLHVDVPGGPELRLEHLVLDASGTLTDRGQLVEGVEERLVRLRHDRHAGRRRRASRFDAGSDRPLRP